ncbi:MAG TPA: hypothetical protein VGS97_13735 [Actinocrinis sp.]|uniref:hypothetical protein n=1 Tax=Actinocrinis sp. TaxID=1920516 RepID=UPI002DDD5497|nr:hypothetical protein [Actinocrinis sp.]HEV2345153.1 hypothetical protein [Actinocrinis sp.]
MEGFEWTPAQPVQFPGQVDGWCVRNAFCDLLGWAPDSEEADHFIESPKNSDLRRLCEHLGLEFFDLADPAQWNKLITTMDHPGIATFFFPSMGGGHSVYVHHVHALLHHWPTQDGLPRTDLPVMNWPRFGWPLGGGHLQFGPLLHTVVLDPQQPPRPEVPNPFI